MSSLDFANEHAWPHWCAELYERVLQGDIQVFDDERVTGLTFAGFQTAYLVHLDATKPEVGYRGILERLTQRIEIEQWLREMLQNAIDARIPDRTLNIVLDLGSDYLKWSHDGRCFKGPETAARPTGEMGALIEPGVSTKRASFENEGRFGVGFKGWMFFYDQVCVSCTDQGTMVESAWRNDGTRLIDEGNRWQEYNGARATTFEFTEPRQGLREVDGITVLRELGDMLRVREHSVTIRITQGSQEFRLVHQCERYSLPEPDLTGLRILNRTETTEVIEQNIVAVRAIIGRDESIRRSVDNHIQTERERYSSGAAHGNPWSNTTADDWFDQVRLTVGIIVDENFAGRRYWLHSLAPVERAIGWPGTALESEGRWLIDGPFFLEMDRLSLKDDPEHNQANAALLKQAFYLCSGALTNTLIAEHSDIVDQMVSITPVDDLIRSAPRYTDQNPFKRIVWDTSQVSPKRVSYSEVFPTGLFVNANGRKIPPTECRVISHEARLGDSDDDLHLTQWLEEQDKSLICEHWGDVIPFSLTEPIHMWREEDCPVLQLVQSMDSEELYRRLEQSGLLEALIADHDAVLYMDWLTPPVPDGVAAFVLEAPPRSDDLISRLWTLCGEFGVQVSDNEDVKRFFTGRASDSWSKIHGTWVLHPPPDATDQWWTDRLIEALHNLEVLRSEHIREMAESLNNSDSTWFAADIRGLRKEIGEDDSTFTGSALIRRDWKRGEWTLALETLSAWTLRSSAVDEPKAKSLWRSIGRTRERIDVNKEVGPNALFPCDEGLHKFQDPIAVTADAPINSPELVDFLLRNARDFAVRDAVDGAIVFARPCHAPPELVKVLRQAMWTRLPSMTFTSKLGEIKIDDTGNFGTSRRWTTFANNVWNVREQRNEYQGHGLMIHDGCARSLIRQDVLIRDIGFLRLATSPELEISDKERRRLVLASKANTVRLSDGGTRLSMELVRTHKTSHRAQYSLRRALIRHVLDGLREHMDSERWLQPDGTQLKSLAQLNFTGFVRPINIERIEWLPVFGGEFWAADILDVETSEVVLLDELNITVHPITDELRVDLSSGLKVLLNAVADHASTNTDALDNLAQYLGQVSRLLTENRQIDIPLLFATLGDLNREVRDELESAYDGLARDCDDANKKSVYEKVIHGLRIVRAHTWKTLVPLLDELEEPARQWEMFLDNNLVPPDSVHRFRTGDRVWERVKGYKKLNPHMGFVGPEHAKRVFHISEEFKDATGWTVSQDAQVVILPEQLTSMLAAEHAKKREIGRWREDPSSLLPTSQSIETCVDLHPKWAFAQVMVGLRLWKSRIQAERSSNNPELQDYLPTPYITQGEIGDRCFIFDSESPAVLLGERGWDLRSDSGRLQLVTHRPDSGEGYRNLRVLLQQGLAIDPGILRLSLRTDDGVEQIAHWLGLDVAATLDVVRKLSQGTDLVSPYVPDEWNEWRQHHLQAPDWNQDAARCLAADGAREMLDRYRTALTGLIARGDMGPSRADDYQGKVANLTIGMVDDDLYPEIQSVLLDEPILHVRGENVPLHRFRYRRRSDLLPADLHDFPGNVLLLSAFSQWRATREAENGGLVPSKEPGRTISETVRALLASDEIWGNQDNIILRDVMSVGPALIPVSLRLHKFHAVMMAALDSALDESEA